MRALHVKWGFNPTLRAEYQYWIKYKVNPIGLRHNMNLWQKIKSLLSHKKSNDVGANDRIDQLMSEKARENAVAYLVENIPIATWKEFKQNPDWFLDDKIGYGFYVRNLIRKSGYNPESLTLDNEWGYLLKQASTYITDDRIHHLKNERVCCDYCGEVIEGLPYYNRWGQKFCANHKVPESREERGAHQLPKSYTTTFHSDGSIEYRK